MAERPLESRVRRTLERGGSQDDLVGDAGERIWPEEAENAGRTAGEENLVARRNAGLESRPPGQVAFRRGRLGARKTEDEQPEPPREVALKVIRAGAEFDEASVERFRREAALLARLGSHPHLVGVHDAGRDGDRLWFAMDLVRGLSLSRRIEEGPLPPREAARIVAEAASGLAFAHAAGVVRRDVKPANILLDSEGRAVVADFGLAASSPSTAAPTTRPSASSAKPAPSSPTPPSSPSTSPAHASSPATSPAPSTPSNSPST